jgi:hypothetical protein
VSSSASMRMLATTALPNMLGKSPPPFEPSHRQPFILCTDAYRLSPTSWAWNSYRLFNCYKDDGHAIQRRGSGILCSSMYYCV